MLLICVVGGDARKTVHSMRWPNRKTVQEANNAIRELCGRGDDTWSLFSLKHSRFLRRHRTLAEENLKSGDRLEYRHAVVEARVHMMSGPAKACRLDMTQSVGELTAELCEKMSVSSAERCKYLLRYQERSGVRRRLKPDETLLEQGFHIGREFVFAKLYAKPRSVDDLEAAFRDCSESVSAGEWPTSEEEVAELAALLLQVRYGDYDRGKELNWDACLPISWRGCNAKGALRFLLCWKRSRAESSVGLGSLPRAVAGLIARRVYGGHCEELLHSVLEAWQLMGGIACEEAKAHFVVACRALPTYGMVSFPCRNGLRVGAARDLIWSWDPLAHSAKAVRGEWSLLQVRRWRVDETKKTTSLEFSDAPEEVLFETDDCANLATLVSELIDIMLRTQRD